jgi:hypothetical protein
MAGGMAGGSGGGTLASGSGSGSKRCGSGCVFKSFLLSCCL